MTSGQNMSSYFDWTTCTNLYHQLLQWPCSPSKKPVCYGQDLTTLKLSVLQKEPKPFTYFAPMVPIQVHVRAKTAGILWTVCRSRCGLEFEDCLLTYVWAINAWSGRNQRLKSKVETICWQSRQNFTWKNRRGRCHTRGICLFRLKTEIAALERCSGYSHFGWFNRTKPDLVGSHLCLSC